MNETEELNSTNIIYDLSVRAHRQARASGFWDDYELLWDIVYDESGDTDSLQDMAVAQKVALIFTEVLEFFKEDGDFQENPKIVEEIADVTIRIFDVLGYFIDDENDLVCEVIGKSHDTLSQKNSLYSAKLTSSIGMYSALSQSLQCHKKGDFYGFFLNLCTTILIAQDYVSMKAESTYALREAIEAKMEVNKTRGYKHGSNY